MPTRKSVYLTGSTGYIGGKFLQRINADVGYSLFDIKRNRADEGAIFISDFTDSNQLKLLTKPADVFIHIAGMAHVFSGDSSKNEIAFKKANVDVTVALAKRAAEIGVKRFIFLSSVSIYGQENTHTPLNEKSSIKPSSPYAISKYEAEQQLLDISAQTGMELVIIRPPMVYGPSAPGNFSKLSELVKRKFPLPFQAINNKRSFIAIDNLIDFIVTCIHHPKAANNTFVISDRESISTTQLIQLIAEGFGIKARLFYVPKFLAKTLFILIRKEKFYRQLFCSFEIDSSKAMKILDWQPPVTTNQAIKMATKAITSNPD